VSGPALDVVIGDGAIEELAERVRGDALVVADANTWEVAGGRVTRALPRAREFVFPERSGLLAGPDEVAAVRAALAADATPIAVGSGVITDIVRYAAHQTRRDFLSVPTAASMDGYASSVAALQIDGVKVTYPARAPRAILADPRIAAAAPPELTRAGIGDLLGKATSGVDWRAAHLLYGEPLDEPVASRVLAAMNRAVAGIEPVLAGEPGAIRDLLEGLIESGVAMAAVGDSRPASGCEHHASHFWDLLAARGRRPHASHGLQVGYATRFAMRLQRFAFGGGVPALAAPVPAADPLGPEARAWLGEPTPEIIAAVGEKARFAAAVQSSWPAGQEDWETVCGGLAAGLAGFAAVDAALARAGIPDAPGWLDVDAATLDATFRHATRLRARYTVVDFLEGQRALDEAIAAMVGQIP
jgi:glycerol-1-phosphate dehydrogenase [NAD(P)+]